MGHTSAAPVPSQDLSSRRYIGTLLRGELELFRDGYPEVMNSPARAPILRLTFCAARLLVCLHDLGDEPSDLMNYTYSLVSSINQMINTATAPPQTHHFVALACLSLLELMKYDETKDMADSGLHVLLHEYVPASRWDPAIRDIVQKKRDAILTATASTKPDEHALTASQGLQRLADLATATEEASAPMPVATDIVGLREYHRRRWLEYAPKTYAHFHELRDIVKNGFLDVFCDN